MTIKTVFGCDRDWWSSSLKQNRNDWHWRGERGERRVSGGHVYSSSCKEGLVRKPQTVQTTGSKEGRCCLHLKDEVEIKEGCENIRPRNLIIWSLGAFSTPKTLPRYFHWIVSVPEQCFWNECPSFYMGFILQRKGRKQNFSICSWLSFV